MTAPHLRRAPCVLVGALAAGALLAPLARVAAGAQVPSPAAVERAVQQDPRLAEQIRARIRQSGLTPEQVRARLRASGYPESLLDQYLAAGDHGQPGAVPTAFELSAIAALGMPLSQSGLPLDTGLVTTPGAAAPPSDVFGLNVFRRSTTQFLPLLAGPVPDDYRLGPGDVLVLILTGDVELAYTLQVTRQGFVVVPQVGQIFVSNLTLEQLRDVLYARLGRAYSGVRRGAGATTRFDVSVTNVRANQIFVVGDVVQPGAYQISSLGTVLTALYAAGGIAEEGNTRAVQIQRAGTTVATFDLYDYLLRGDTRADIRLETGDVVFVPPYGARVWVSGAVRRPAIYEARSGDQLLDVLRAAGGFRADASLRRLTVHRILPGATRSQEALARAAMVLELGRGPAPDTASDRLSVTVPSFGLADGDSVVVDSLPGLGPDGYYVAVVGMVRKPGPYPWRPGLTLRDALRLAGGPRTGAELREAEIARLPADRSLGQMAVALRVPLDSSYLGDRDSAGRYVGAPGAAFPPAGSAPEIALQPFDNVLILQQPEFELQRTVRITGEVQYPGSYALRSKDERLADLVRRAGGLTPRAYAEGIRFYRPLFESGRINVRLTDAMVDSASRDNIILQPDDSVHIPEYLPSVRVTGAVNAPGSVLWRRGAGLDYYIGAAGGFSPVAEGGGTSVRYANGEVRTRSKFLLFSRAPKPDPGSEVFVPTKDPAAKVDYVALFGAVAQILASTVAIVVVATR